MLPPKAYDPSDDLEPTLKKYARMFDLDAIGEQIGYPFFMKPYHGGGWKGVTRINDSANLHLRQLSPRLRCQRNRGDEPAGGNPAA